MEMLIKQGISFMKLVRLDLGQGKQDFTFASV